MQVYTYSEARQKLAVILDQAENSGKVIIRRKDVGTFALVPEKVASSPLDVPSIKANITSQEAFALPRFRGAAGRKFGGAGSSQSSVRVGYPRTNRPV